ncbi:MAG: MupA/Atu3671 family FMN-dependent luciferase-like monooxygenase, partial [Acidobacteriota bacterium]
VVRETLVGIYMNRSLDLLLGIIAVLKAGGAYLPFDTANPKHRLTLLLNDAKPHLLLTQNELLDSLPEGNRVICLDTDWQNINLESDENLSNIVDVDNLAYVIYTSGSTGVPKGVMICHGNVANFIIGMDKCLGYKTPGVWLAVTNVAFDISILELLWTLTRGFKVVIQAEPETNAYVIEPVENTAARKLDFSLFYFASDDDKNSKNKYRLLIEGAKFADQNGFSAVWTPERHFHAFGGLYPNPAVTSAAVAAVTENIQIRAGSVVLPLHNPIRIAEEWSVVDNLSNGRVGISFASGWHANDFALAPENYQRRKEIMNEGIETVRKLWQGEAVTVKSGMGNDLNVEIFPRPIQSRLPIWITSAGNIETFQLAGEVGANLLTHLLGQSIDELAEKIAVYRDAWRKQGNSPGEGYVTLMLHTFVGKDLEVVREKVRKPFCDYLRSSAGLWRSLARNLGQDIDSADLSEDDMERLLARAFDRYFETSGLFGTPASCLHMVNKLKAIGVDEVACLIDFGVDFDSVMASLRYLNILQKRANKTADEQDYSLPAQITRHQVTHMQCTPSMARMIKMNPPAEAALSSLESLLIGGEALPTSLAMELKATVNGNLFNMYGPTETTIWSANHRLDRIDEVVPIGKPIANTEIYILNKYLEPQPIGVAGELYIGGDGLARGYLDRPELTSEKFIPNPFSDKPGTRLYKTGDLVRYLSDGNMEFLGRLDHQVKIRGYRIELGEIEALLAQHPSVRENIVIVREDLPGQARLVAYLVAKPYTEIDVNELRSLLKEKLPEYMLPAAYVILNAIPLTSNGKVNRQALPAPDSLRPDLTTAYIAPHTELERTLAAVWQEVLQIEVVGTEDNFFDLGGHSLLMAQVHSRLRDDLRLTVPIIELFKYPTINSLAKFLSSNRHEETLFQQTDARAQKRKQAIHRQKQLMNRRAGV